MRWAGARLSVHHWRACEISIRQFKNWRRVSGGARGWVGLTSAVPFGPAGVAKAADRARWQKELLVAFGAVELAVADRKQPVARDPRKWARGMAAETAAALCRAGPVTSGGKRLACLQARGLRERSWCAPAPKTPPHFTTCNPHPGRGHSP